jgi:hypothetical protein
VPAAAEATWFRASCRGVLINAPSHSQERIRAEHINLILMVALLLAVDAATFYLGTSFSVPPQTAGFIGPISSW